MKSGVVDVGGGLRGIYAVGVLDYCMDNDIHFDLGIGVSAGSANLASFTAKQRGRNYQFYTEYAFRKEYMGLGNFLSKKSYFDMDYVYGILSNSDGENPLDYNAFKANPMEYIVVATDALTGKAKYFYKKDILEDHYDALKASSSLPFFCKPYTIDKTPYYDGALGDCIPIKKAFEMGCDKVVLILTKPEDYIRKPHKDYLISKLISKSYPLAAKELALRAKHYNDCVSLAKEYAKNNRVLIIAPDDTYGVDTLKKDKQSLIRLYNKGYEDGAKIKEFIAEDN